MYFDEEKKENLFINAYELINHSETDLESIMIGLKTMIILEEMNFKSAQTYLLINSQI
jgi:hypothetical protein